MDEGTSLKVAMWGFGLCVTGFLFLVAWLRQITDKSIIAELKEIKLALIGDLTKPGIITILYRHTGEIKAIQEKCEKTHEKGAE